MLMILVSALLLTTTPAFSSDHIDGPVTTKHAVGDITDLYAFPAPSNPDRLSLVLNVYPMVSTKGHFSKKVQYNFLIRKVRNVGKYFSTEDETRLSCSFNDAHAPLHYITCKSNDGLVARAEVGGSKSSGDFSLFAGMRSDPFFFNADWAITTSNESIIPPPNPKNTMSRLNVLSIVIELDRPLIFGGDFELLAIAAESNTYDSPTSDPRRLDRVGRPEITNVTLVARGGEDVRDEYNLESPFEVNLHNRQKYFSKIIDNLEYYDQLDNQQDWSRPEIEDLASILVDDYLVLDLTKPCTERTGFLAIELAILKGQAHDSCGGRQLNDDIMDTLYSTYINHNLGEAIGDGVDKPYKKIANSFPYLRKPDKDILARIKAFLAAKKIGR